MTTHTIDTLMALAYDYADEYADTYEADHDSYGRITSREALRAALTETLQKRDESIDYLTRQCEKYAGQAAPQVASSEKRTLYECRSCGHLYNEKVSSCDCMENETNEYNEWVATPKD